MWDAIVPRVATHVNVWLFTSKLNPKVSAVVGVFPVTEKGKTQTQDMIFAAHEIMSKLAARGFNVTTIVADSHVCNAVRSCHNSVATSTYCSAIIPSS